MLDLSFFIGLFIGVFLLLCAFFILRHFHKSELAIIRNQGLLSDLELATTDQLLKEFRERPKNTYILIMPIDQKDENGLKIELNHVNPYNGLEMLHLVTTIITREMKLRGMEVPKVPEELDDYNLE